MKVELNFAEIEGLKIATKIDADSQDLVAVIQFETKVHPGDVARLLNLQRQFKTMYCHIGSQQAELDLVWRVVKQGGEIAEDTETPALTG